jgi:GTP-binding protein
MSPTTSRALPIVAIVGRPNVGKSMLFNRLTRSGTAVVDNRPGVTRDRNYQETTWNGRRFVLVDTGGLLPSEGEGIAALVRGQAETAIREADAIVFVVDRTTGPVPTDAEIAALLRRSPKPIILAVNKVDAEEHELDAHEFSSLGLGDPTTISALHGRRAGDLLDAIVAAIPDVVPEEETEPGIRVAFVGRPNVGKSSLVNRIVGSDVAIVDAEPGTTRDAVDTAVTAEGTRFVLVDTAGLRRQARMERGIEFFSSLRAVRSIERCDVAVLVVDATTGVVAQDARIAGFADEAGKALIIAFNKWDLVEKDGTTADLYAKHAQAELTFASYAPVLQVSALTGQRVPKILPLARDVYEQASTRRATHEVNEIIMKAVARRPPAAGRRANILYATQTGVRPPTFVVFTNDVKAVDHAYRRYLVNQLRREYGFAGTPIRIVTKRKQK